MHKYFVFIWDERDLDSALCAASIQSALLSAPQWERAYSNSGLLVIHEPLLQHSASSHPLSNNQGVIIGTLFHRGRNGASSRPSGQIDDLETHLIQKSDGRHLVRNYWGSYLAVVHGHALPSWNILRDPTANLACYHCKKGGLHVFFSDMESFTRYVDMSLSIHWTYVATRMLAGVTLSRDCAVNEIEDIPGGEWLTLSGASERRLVLWHPAQFCVEEALEDETRAAEELRSTAVSTIRALASEHDDILVLLSGGLDSSIVAGALSEQATRQRISCLNFFPSGDVSAAPTDLNIPGASPEVLAKLRRIVDSADEREFARKVAEKCGFRLFERERPVFAIDFARLYQAPLAPRPSGYGFIMDEDDAECECATATRATACFSGQGGDSVFYGTQLAIGALDYAFLHPFGSHLVHHVLSTAALSRESAAHVFSKVIRHGYLRAPLPEPFEPLNRPHLLNDDVADTISDDYFRHPWVDGISHLCPGKHYHVLGVTTCVPLYHHIYNRERIAPAVHPFASQPIVETCLRIPTYILLANGISRGLARRTFADLLPPEVVRRTAKGSGMAFMRAVVARNMAAIREHLLDGMLVRESVLDRRKLDSYLTEEQAFLTVKPEQIMDYLACEAWLTQLNSMR